MSNLFINSGNPIPMPVVERLLEKISVRLPVDYKNFVASVNGGEPNRNFFELRKYDSGETNSNCYIVIDVFFQFNQLEDVWQNTKEDLLDMAFFPIAEVRGGSLICCRQSNGEMADIVLFDYNFGVLELNLTLNEFLGELIPEEEVDYRKYGYDFTLPGE